MATTKSDLLNDAIQEAIKLYFPNAYDRKTVNWAVNDLISEVEAAQEHFEELPDEAKDMLDKPFEVQIGEIL